MGQDKALLSLPGSSMSFLQHLLGVLSPLCDELVLVVRDQEQANQYTRLVPPSVHIVTDQIPSMGPLMGLYSGLSAINAPYAFVTAVDTPLLQSALVTFLLGLTTDTQAVIPLVDGHPQMLLAVYSVEIRSIIEEQLRAGHKDVRSLLKLVATHLIKEEDIKSIDPELRSFMNVNRPEDLARLASLEHPL